MFEIKNPKNIELPLENCKICGTPTNPCDMFFVPPHSKICGRCYATFYKKEALGKPNLSEKPMNRYNAQILNDKGEYHLQFETNSRENFDAMEKLAQKFIDNKPQPPKDEPIKYVKLANPKLEHTENLWNGMPNYNIKYNIKAQVNNIADKAIYDAIIKYATEQGITDLFLIDEEFVKSALINELSRIAYENAEKEAKENGYIRVKLDLPKLPRTNFDRITESVDSFVKWVLDNYHSVPEQFPCQTSCNKDCGECFKEWLQNEIEK